VRRKIDHWQTSGADVGAGKIRWESRVAGFGGSQRDERGAGRRLGRWGRFREVALDGDAEQEGSGQQDERDMAVPAHITAVG